MCMRRHDALLLPHLVDGSLQSELIPEAMVARNICRHSISISISISRKQQFLYI